MATRDLTTVVSNALDDDVISPFFAVDLLFDNNPVYIWTGIGTNTISGKDYVGVGDFLSVSMTNETSELSATGANIVLSGIPSTTNLALALTEEYQGRRGTIYLGMMSTTTSYSEIFSGYMDQMNIAEGVETSTIEITFESKLIDLERPRINRYTSAFQRDKFPNDKGLDFVETLQDREIVWGRNVE